MSELARERRLVRFASALLFETPGGQRYTQDSPILPNVWIGFAKEPRKPQKLILTLDRKRGGGRAVHEIREMLKRLRTRVDTGFIRQRPRVAAIPGQIAAELYFDEVMRVALPLTPWWREAFEETVRAAKEGGDGSGAADWEGFPQHTDARLRDFTDGLLLLRRQSVEDQDGTKAALDSDTSLQHLSAERRRYLRKIPVELLWIVRIAGVIGSAFQSGKPLLSEYDEVGSVLHQDFLARGLYPLEPSIEPEQRPQVPQALRTHRAAIAGSFLDLYEEWSHDGEQPAHDADFIWRITQNRPVHLAVSKSALTVKADAARRLFDVSCKALTWAVVDSGIDSTHQAFRDTSVEAEADLRRTTPDDEDLDLRRLGSRVTMTLDFTRLRELLDYDVRRAGAANDPLVARNGEYDRLIASLSKKIQRPGEPDAAAEARAHEEVERLRSRIARQRDVDWEDLEQLIVDKTPAVPTHDHGTHVAGILAADWIDDRPNERSLPLGVRTRRMQGVCPDLNLIDVRVFRDDGRTDEFEVLAAIQFLRWMNSRAGYMVCHGINLSISVVHEVRRFACGQTPICDECNEASALGMVVVAAAGNRGFESGDPNEVSASDGYRPVSITDPGNAADVITVGATHRKRPHEYGVSYFSSRGPTGDGRIKPDLVAPGEKIKGPTPDSGAEFKDGTSMAAPHVSGGAAMLMARHSELVGQPQRVKRILCETATDLGRERYFQGHGLLDILRALQSV